MPSRPASRTNVGTYAMHGQRVRCEASGIQRAQQMKQFYVDANLEIMTQKRIVFGRIRLSMPSKVILAAILLLHCAVRKDSSCRYHPISNTC